MEQETPAFHRTMWIHVHYGGCMLFPLLRLGEWVMQMTHFDRNGQPEPCYYLFIAISAPLKAF